MFIYRIFNLCTFALYEVSAIYIDSYLETLVLYTGDSYGIYSASGIDFCHFKRKVLSYFLPYRQCLG